jgi:hypothetical protein
MTKSAFTTKPARSGRLDDGLAEHLGGERLRPFSAVSSPVSSARDQFDELLHRDRVEEVQPDHVRSGRWVAIASRVIGSDDVFDARMASLPCTMAVQLAEHLELHGLVLGDRPRPPAPGRRRRPVSVVNVSRAESGVALLGGQLTLLDAPGEGLLDPFPAGVRRGGVGLDDDHVAARPRGRPPRFPIPSTLRRSRRSA